MSRGLGKNQQKLLLLLQGGIALGLSGSPKRYFKIITEIKKGLNEIDKDSLVRSIQSLYKSRLVTEKYNKDGTVTLVLTEKGRKKALTYNLDSLGEQVCKEWDGFWRIVIYDIPETYRVARDSLRMHLKDVGFIELQHSVWIFPHDVAEKVEFLVEYYKIGRYTRLIVADFIDNEDYLKQKFTLN